MIDDFTPGAVLHLIKKITHHRAPGSGVLVTAELTPLTHVTVRVLGKTVGRNPTPDEIEAMVTPPVTVSEEMVDATDTIHALMRSLMQDKPSGKVSRSWMHEAIRHSARNCEFETENDGDELRRYDGEIVADILNLLADKCYIMMTEAP